MTRSSLSALRPEAKIQLSFPESQDWRISNTFYKSPVFLASQKVAGVVEVRYRKDSSAHLNDHLHITLI
ncbi:hypothetical protein LTS08_005927, partial [Lithohypha guttulata]